MNQKFNQVLEAIPKLKTQKISVFAFEKSATTVEKQLKSTSTSKTGQNQSKSSYAAVLEVNQTSKNSETP